MAYFFRDDAYRHRDGDRRHGRAVKPFQLPPMHLKGRDEVISNQIDQMQDTLGTEDFLMKKIDRSEAKQGGKAPPPVTARSNNDIFGPPKLDTPPTARLRPDLPDDVIKKLWADQQKAKAENAALMAGGPSMVERMIESKYPVPHPPSPTEARKKAIGLPRPPVAEISPAGFNGLGAFSAPIKPQGPRVRLSEFEPPMLQPKKRTRGRKQGCRPVDTWEFGPGGKDPQKWASAAAAE